MKKKLNQIVLLIILIQATSGIVKAQNINEQLINAVKTNNNEQVKQLLKKGSDVNSQDKNGATVLMWAVYSGDIETVKYLLKKKADYNKKGVIYTNKEKTGYYGNILSVAAGENKPQILKYLLKKCKINIEDQEYNPKSKKDDGWTALQWAASKANDEIIEILLSKGANINANYTSDKGTPLIYALQAKKYTTAKILIEADADVNMQTSEGRTALYYISTDNKPKILELLLKKGANPNIATNQGFTPLIISAYNNKFENCKLLVKYSAGVYRRDKYSKTAVDYAFSKGYEDIGNYLYEKGTQNTELIDKIKKGINYFSKEQYQRAINLYKEIFPEIESQYGRYDTVIYAKVLLQMAYSSQSIGNYKNAVKYYKLDEKVYKNLNDTLNKEFIKIVLNCGDAYKKALDFKNAEIYFNRTVALIKKVYGKEDTEYGASLLILAHLYYNMNSYKKSEEIFLKAIGILKKNNAKELYSACLGNLAILYGDTENFNKSELLYIEDMKLRSELYGKKSVKYALSLNNLATLYMQLGNYTEALELYSQAISIFLDKEGKDDTNYLVSLQNTAKLYSNIKDYKRAEKYFKLVAEKEKEILGENNSSYATSIHNLAELYTRMNKLDTALTIFIKANNIFKNLYGEKNIKYASSLNSIACVNQLTGDYLKAEQLFIEVFAIKKEIIPESRFLTEKHNLAVLYGEMGKFAKSTKERNEKYKKAEKLFIEVNKIQNLEIEKSGKYMSEKEREMFINNIVKLHFIIYHSFFLTKRKENPIIPGIIYNNALIHKGLLLKSSITLKNRILNSKNDKLIKKYEEFIKTGKKLEILYSQTCDKRILNVDSIEIIYNNLEKELTRKSQNLAKDSHLGKVKWQDIQKTLKKDEIAIEFINFRYFDSKKWTDSTLYYALILKKEYKYPKVVFLFEEKQLQKLLKRKLNENDFTYVKRLYSPSSSESDSLYSLIFKPLKKHISEIKTIYISPTGLLNRIAFDAITINKTTILSNKYKIYYTSSTDNLINKTKLYSKNIKNTVLFGGIKYDISIDEMKKFANKTGTKEVTFVEFNNQTGLRNIDSLNRSISWSYLPGTLSETEDINTTFIANNINTTLYSGKDASEEIFKALSGNQPDVLHISTHGFYFPNSKVKNSISTTRNLSGFIDKDVQYTSSDNSLLRSGLLLAGGQNIFNGEEIPEGIEDGVLSAYEVSHLNFSNTKLAVLSACQTGLGDVKGNEGVYGLQRSFKMAGVEYLLFSLWEVPDNQTKELMTNFYKNWFSGMEIREAFKKAQNQLKTKYAKVEGAAFAWAAFVLMK